MRLTAFIRRALNTTAQLFQKFLTKNKDIKNKDIKRYINRSSIRNDMHALPSM